MRRGPVNGDVILTDLAFTDFMNALSRIFASIGTGAVSALIGLMAELAAGLVAWAMFRGLPGVIFALVIGGCSADIIRRFTLLPASPTAGAAGAMVGAFLAIATGEAFPPGSIDWAVKGGLYGAMIGVPIGGILGPLALLSRDKTLGQRETEAPRE